MTTPNKININICLLNDNEQEISLYFIDYSQNNIKLITTTTIPRKNYKNDLSYKKFKKLYDIYTILDDKKLHLINNGLLDTKRYDKESEDYINYIKNKLQKIYDLQLIENKIINLYSLNDEIKTLTGKIQQLRAQNKPKTQKGGRQYITRRITRRKKY